LSPTSADPRACTRSILPIPHRKFDFFLDFRSHCTGIPRILEKQAESLAPYSDSDTVPVTKRPAKPTKIRTLITTRLKHMSTRNIGESVFCTRWTIINQARDKSCDPEAARKALNEVILRYRPAILAAIRRCGIDPADCEDVCHDFIITKFLTNTLPKADPRKGRFRTFLVHMVRLYVIDYRRKQAAEFRGRGVTDSLEDLAAGDASEAALAVEPRMELEFEMDFALSMHEETLKAIRKERTGRQLDLFEMLAPCILEKEQGISGAVATQLGMEEAAVRKGLSRLRESYASEFLMRTSEITDDDEDPKLEMKELVKLVLMKQKLGKQETLAT
jgi:DNA-directed RNA polymerase specialized sigma24 family protein